MTKSKIIAADKKHFESLIKELRNNGFMLITLGKKFAELETATEFVTIEYWYIKLSYRPYGEKEKSNEKY